MKNPRYIWKRKPPTLRRRLRNSQLNKNSDVQNLYCLYLYLFYICIQRCLIVCFYEYRYAFEVSVLNMTVVTKLWITESASEPRSFLVWYIRRVSTLLMLTMDRPMKFVIPPWSNGEIDSMLTMHKLPKEPMKLAVLFHIPMLPLEC